MAKLQFNSIKTLIGTSGWMYNHWKGPFYPKKISNVEMLNFYTDHFSTVETNSTLLYFGKFTLTMIHHMHLNRI